MSSLLRGIAKKAETRPFYLASVLRLTMDSERMNEAALAERLGCTEEVLAKVQLCRAPREDGGAFREDVMRIADAFGLNADALAKACRTGLVLRAMPDAKAEAANAYLAARDREEGEQP